MPCVKCGVNLDPHALFCPQCGTRQEESSESAAAQEAAAAEQAAGSNSQSRPANDTVAKVQENVSKASKEYWAFYKAKLKRPAAGSEQSSADQWVNGIITVVLTAIMLPLSMYLLYQIHNEYISGFFMTGYGLFSTPFTTLLVRPFFVILVLLAVIYGAIYVSTRLMKSEYSYKDVLGRFGAYLVIPMSLLAVMLLFSLIGVYQAAALFLLLGFLGAGTAISYTIYSLRNKDSAQGLDPFYAVLFTYLIVGILYWIIS
ncbi:zinc ribbon domain-containing protein [Xylanibacillus composti]|uniref:Zinc ribbon domain-containing protein n=1 Tax=Xylanibacillus composti TaxID=1572762 RepID=A0A8J4GYH9_9BACL|nr:zinc ribbon domain-containing protein [Xylanibacillus composti]MDT9725051.1 zinc ribbon domain-containing protein [Xylanibacillus composti]GIQ67469.1 hypothetical protein XYCOK13_02930 [Xylanibacillus composti]